MSTATEAAFYKEATRATVPEMAAECQRLLGQRLVAYVTGHRSPKMVGRWALEKSEPQAEAKERLRALYRTVRILGEHEQPDTIRAWLMGANPQLHDQAPVELLREAKLTELTPVFHAAENFVSD